MSYISKIRAKVGNERIFNPGVRAIILNEQQEILLQRRVDTGHWSLPAGGVELGETALEALKREVFEETGLKISEAEPMALYSGLEQQFEYPNGDQVQSFAIAFIIRQWSGSPCADGEEGLEVKFWSLEYLPPNLVKRHLDTLQDFKNYDGEFIVADSNI
jgi:mutator protein MutT